MEKFKVTIEETYAQSFDIIANSPEMAVELAKEMYDNCEIILDNGEVQLKQCAVLHSTQWHKF